MHKSSRRKALYDSVTGYLAGQNALGRTLVIGPHKKHPLLDDFAAKVNVVGVDISPGPTYENSIKANANVLPFNDNTFDTILCMQVLEHDKYFWKSLSEIRRVAKQGSLVVFSVPGYDKTAKDKLRNEYNRVLLNIGMSTLGIIPGRNAERAMEDINESAAANDVLYKFYRFLKWDSRDTKTYRMHNIPGDYYRFSKQAAESVFLNGMVEKDVDVILDPPTIIAKGVVQS